MLRVEVEFKHKPSGDTRYELFEVHSINDVNGVAAQYLKKVCGKKYWKFYEDKNPEDFEITINDVG